MKRLFLAIGLALFSLGANAQSSSTVVGPGAGASPPALIGARGTTLPATCTPGQLFFKTDATAGQNIYECGPANTWTQQIGGTGTVPLANTHIFVGSAGNIATDVALSQDCAMANTGAITCTKTNNVALTSAATTAIGTSGATLPLLNGTNTWSGVQTFSAGDLAQAGAGAGKATLAYANTATSSTLTLPTSASDTLAALGLAQTWTAAQSFNSSDLILKGATSGTITLNAAATAGANTLTLPAGTTDFSATGGASNVVKQTSAGGAFTVAQLAASDLSNGTSGSGAVALVSSPVFVTPALGTPASGVLTNATGYKISSLAAATAGLTIANGNNTGQVWNWANTADSTDAFTFGETSAATNGTSTSGVPNQNLLKLTTVAASTQSPLSVYSRGSHVFSVSPSAAQILGTAGAVGNPTYSSAAATNAGLYFNGTAPRMSSNGTAAMNWGSNRVDTLAGSTAAPGLSDLSSGNTGLSWAASNTLSVVNASDGEWCRYLTRAFQCSRGSADTTAFAINGRKSRGTVASPTVITTGDDLLTITGYGYVGATNTYQDAATIRFDSVGTISDATNGIGGELVVATKKQGANTTATDRWKIDQFGHKISISGTGNTPTMGACGTSPSVAGTDDVILVTVGTGGSATSCAVNFGTTRTTAPVCIAQNGTDKVAYSMTTSTTAVTVAATAAFTASSKFYILCQEYQ